MSTDQKSILEALERVGRKDQRSELPMFSGKLDPEECMDWLEALDNFFECDNTPESQRVKVAKSKMKGYGLSWWNFLRNESKDEGKEPLATWRRMKLKINRKFV